MRLAGVSVAMLLGCAVFSTAATAQNATMEVTQATINRMLQRIGTLSDAGVAQPGILANLPGLFEFCEFVGFIECPGLGAGTLGLKNRIPMARCRRVGGGWQFMPTGEPVSWQWWVKDASVSIGNGAMTFTATVRVRFGDLPPTETTRTVGAKVDFLSWANAVYLVPENFNVPIVSYLGYPGPVIPGTPPVFQGAPPVDVARLLRIRLPIEPQAFSVPLPDGTTRSMSGRVLSASAQYQPGILKVDFDVGF